ncbi:MAG: homogentisate 1,2-dioxygenase [Alphaproteobacteria bacterium]|nr:homogentisate 1,2-dioxygenase [Alphaproteobacteria bacterium]
MTHHETQQKSAYMNGFGNIFSSEAIKNALPVGQNSPQKCAYGLYAEQISGTAFTAPRKNNKYSWLYRIRPSVKHSGPFRRIEIPLWTSAPHHGTQAPLGPIRWDPLPFPDKKNMDFIDGMHTITTAGDVHCQAGIAVHVYLATQSMTARYFYNADGELLIVPQEGRLEIATECGRLELAPAEIGVIPRGMKFAVHLLDDKARGFVCENYGSILNLPELGPIGANGSARPSDFLTPNAAYEDKDMACRLTVKWGGQFYETELAHSPLDVVAWQGNYAPYKYDLRLFAPIGAILRDHPDPSIFTVLTSQTDTPGIANVDFVVFTERWLVAENTFRPPWYHMNVMSEFMGLIYGVYDAKPQGFTPGGMSLHNCMLPHGPDMDAFTAASEANLKPQKLDNTLSFMFETRFAQHVTDFAAHVPQLQKNYMSCWDNLTRQFEAPKL